MTEPATPLLTTVPETAAGRRFDAVLAELFPAYSRSRLAEWIKSGDALLDGRQVRPRDPVHGGESVSLSVVLDVQTRSEPEDIALDVLFEDEHVIVIDKPAGLVVHPGAGNPTGTLVNALLYRDPSMNALPRAGIVHRLDKDTSGVMVVARNLPAHTALVAQLSSREVHRQYLAVVVGAWRRAELPERMALAAWLAYHMTMFEMMWGAVGFAALLGYTLHSYPRRVSKWIGWTGAAVALVVGAAQLAQSRAAAIAADFPAMQAAIEMWSPVGGDVVELYLKAQQTPASLEWVADQVETRSPHATQQAMLLAIWDRRYCADLRLAAPWRPDVRELCRNSP